MRQVVYEKDAILPRANDTIYLWLKNSVLHIQDNGGFQSRHLATIQQILDADKLYGLNDFGPVIISSQDFPKKHFKNVKREIIQLPDFPVLRYCHDDLKELEKIVPDFVFHSWPESGIFSFQETIGVLKSQLPDLPATKKCGWIGTVGNHENRTAAFELGKQYPSFFDIISMTWKKPSFLQKIKHGFKAGLMSQPSVYLSVLDQVSKWKYLLDLEGVGYSGRLKLFLFSSRVVFIQDRPYKEWFHHDLEPYKHYIPVKRDCSDLLEQYHWIEERPEKYKEIVFNANAFANRYLSYDAVLKRWETVLSQF